ncbi:nucleoside 2-deoxyribosyltransferase [candidate division KSB1 bacterium]|nr:nucleoside 2-deoxyribosyltransferase [candidate division KSB1 bacterium]
MKFAPYTPDFNRLRTTLLAGKADRVPLMELGIDEGLMGQFLGKSIQSLKDKIDFYRCAGYDYVKLSPIINMNPAGIVPESGLAQSAESDLDRARTWGTEGKGIITSWEEFERFRWADVNDKMFLPFEQAEKIMPDEMKIIGQYGDIFTFTWEFMGFESFSYALIENPDLVTAIFDKVGGIIYGLFERMAQYPGVGGLFYSDDIAYYSGLMVSPRTLHTYLYPYMKKIGDLCKTRDIPYIYHSDGRLWDALDDLTALGINALQPIEPKAMDIRELKDKYGDRLGLVGSVDVDLLTRGKPEEIRAVVHELIDDVGRRGGYCVGSGNTVPNYIPIANYRAMLEATWEFGGF